MHWLGNSIFDVKLAAVPLFLGFVILSSYTIWQFEAKKKKSLFLTKNNIFASYFEIGMYGFASQALPRNNCKLSGDIDHLTFEV